MKPVTVPETIVSYLRAKETKIDAEPIDAEPVDLDQLSDALKALLHEKAIVGKRSHQQFAFVGQAVRDGHTDGEIKTLTRLHPPSFDKWQSEELDHQTEVSTKKWRNWLREREDEWNNLTGNRPGTDDDQHDENDKQNPDRQGYPWDDLEPVLDGEYEPPKTGILYLEDRGLLYLGRMHLCFGGDSVGKTWVSNAAAAAVLKAGGVVMHLDYDDNERSNVRRLMLLGVTREQIRHGYKHKTDPGKLDGANVQAIVADMPGDDGRDCLVIVDVVADALAAHSYKENDAGDFLAWVNNVLRPFTRAGATVIINDHVVKDGDNGGHSRGSGAKRGKVDGVSYEVTAPRPMRQGEGGMITLTIRKDRHGEIGAKNTVAAHICFDVKASQPTLDLDHETETDVTFAHDPTLDYHYAVRVTRPKDKPTTASTPSAQMRSNAETIVEALQKFEQPPVTKNQLMTLVTGMRDGDKRAAIDYAIGDGAITVTPGPRNSQLHAYVRPLKEKDP
jgi:hypothetical protein